MKVISFLLSETGTYNNVYARPYITKIDSDVLNGISDKIGRGISVSADLFGGVASSLLAPSTIAGNVVQIPNGWNERRLTFLLVLEHDSGLGGKTITCVQGYTDYVGVSHTGAIDPSMRFYINTLTTVMRNTISDAYGVREYDHLIDSAQVINGVIESDFGYTSNNLMYGLRPSDVLNTTQILDSYALPDVDINDSRVCIGRGSDIQKSRRINAVPSMYLSEMSKAYMQALDLEGLIGGRGHQDVYENAASMLMNDNVGNNNTFIRHLQQLNGGISTTSFTTNDLESIDINISNVTQIVRIGNTTKTTLHTAGSTENWHGSNIETIASTMLANAVPAFMMASKISKLYFRATNQDLTGETSVVFLDVRSILNIDVTRTLEIFKRRLIREVLADVTQGGIIPFTLEMDCSVLGESRITISMFDNPPVPYTTLSAADSTYAPIYTNNKEAVIQVASDMTNVLDAVGSYISGNKESTFMNQQLYSY